MSKLITAVLLCSAGQANAASTNAATTANPIRKVVNLLQSMQSKITAEGEKKEKMFDKYMCYCSNAEGTLGKSISDAETKIPLVEASVKEDLAMKKQLEAEVKEAKENRAEAKDAIAKAEAIREKEA